MSEFLDLLGGFANVPDDKSIMLDELEAFWEFSKDYDLDFIVESGTYKGLTAKRLALLYQDKLIVSYEKIHSRYIKIPKCHYAPNITYVYGKIDRKILNESSAVIIDGPKRLEAIKLAYKCRKIVPFVAIHDMLEYKKQLSVIFDMVVFKGKLAICS